ncbi:DNA cytosine methyltransferase [Pelagibacteraceae bacterium]|nr:DNA cytosine methyltransferase [Pelagibacteraceae bacterium]
MKKNKLKVLSLFAGAGGMDLGFKNAGYDIIWANDFDADSVKTYKRNLGDHIVLGDIEKIRTNNMPNNPDVVIGGFPCQGFSIANLSRRVDDSRNKLYKQMLRVIRAKKPKYFVAENVSGILTLGKGAVIQKIIKDFKSIGYKVDYKILNAANYGVPQSRKRVIIIGNRLGLENSYPKQTHQMSNKQKNLFDRFEKQITTKEAINFLTKVPLSNKTIYVNNRVVHNHVGDTNVHDEFWGRKYPVNQFDICDYLKKWRKKAGISTQKVDEHFGYAHTAGHWFRKDNNSGSIPNPDDWKGLKKLLGFDNKYDKQVTTLIKKKIQFEQSLRITNWKTPSDTLTATSPEIHVNLKRRLSVRECAILQTFPDDFIFEGATYRSMHKQIGNAVPVLLAEKVAKEIKKTLMKTVILRMAS